MTIGLNVGNVIVASISLPTMPTNTPVPTVNTPTTPAEQAQVNPNLITLQMLIPLRNINGAVVLWQLQTIEYDSRMTDPPGRQKSYAKLAPWMTNYRVVSIP